MDAWWRTNKGAFEKQHMTFSGQACITATKGKLKGEKYTFQEEYSESMAKVRNLIANYASDEPWKMETTHWFVAALKSIFYFHAALFKLKSSVLSRILQQALEENGGLSSEDASVAAKQTDRGSSPP